MEANGTLHQTFKRLEMYCSPWIFKFKYVITHGSEWNLYQILKRLEQYHLTRIFEFIYEEEYEAAEENDTGGNNVGMKELKADKEEWQKENAKAEEYGKSDKD